MQFHPAASQLWKRWLANHLAATFIFYIFIFLSIPGKE
jgi:hypothetical protein